MNSPTEIRNPSELLRLNSWQLAPPVERTEIRLEIANAPREKIERWQRRLTRLQSPCGCEQGAGGLLFGLVGYLLYLLLRPGGWDHAGWPEFWVGCGAVVLTTSLGKALGILLGRAKLRRLIDEIRTEWQPQPPPGRHFGNISLTATRQQSSCCGGSSAWRPQ